MTAINFGNTPIDYILYKQQRKDLKITVTLVNGVEVYAPLNAEETAINTQLKKKAPWILNKLNDLNQVEAAVQPKEFVSGEKLPYLGRNYRLKVHREPVEHAQLSFYQGRFRATVPKNWTQQHVQQNLEAQLIQWYRRQADKKLHERIQHYQELINTEPASAQIRTQYKRWGTCTPDRHIYINWRLVMAPLTVFDYVIVHELAHLKINNHSPEFWKLVKSILPDYEKRKEWLRINGMRLQSIGYR